MKLTLSTIFGAGLMLAATSAHADPIVWNFGTPAGDQGTTHVYSTTPAVTPAQNITATAFGPRSPHLFGKNGGGDEVGLGLTNDLTGEDEITVGSFIQLDLFGLTSPPLNSLTFSFQADSSTSPDAWQVRGTNFAGTLLGSTLILAGTDENLHPALPGSILGTYRYLDITATAGNILLTELDNSVNSVPEPASIFVLGIGLIGAGVIRRRAWRQSARA
jgi:hypothetical protein